LFAVWRAERNKMHTNRYPLPLLSEALIKDVVASHD
jgi:hypothetical protein